MFWKLSTVIFCFSFKKHFNPLIPTPPDPFKGVLHYGRWGLRSCDCHDWLPWHSHDWKATRSLLALIAGNCSRSAHGAWSQHRCFCNLARKYAAARCQEQRPHFQKVSLWSLIKIVSFQHSPRPKPWLTCFFPNGLIHRAAAYSQWEGK